MLGTKGVKNMNMRESMNMFHTFAHYLWGKVFCLFVDYENPFKDFIVDI